MKSILPVMRFWLPHRGARVSSVSGATENEHSIDCFREEQGYVHLAMR